MAGAERQVAEESNVQKRLRRLVRRRRAETPADEIAGRGLPFWGRLLPLSFNVLETLSRTAPVATTSVQTRSPFPRAPAVR